MTFTKKYDGIGLIKKERNRTMSVRAFKINFHFT